MSIIVNRISQIATLFTPPCSEADEDEDQPPQNLLEPILKKYEETNNNLELVIQNRENELVCQTSDSIKNSIETAADNFMIYF
jgi:hypothetical protein